MKLTIVYSGILGYEHKLDKVKKIIKDTLLELDECEINDIVLEDINMPYYNGKNADCISRYAEEIKSATGVIFACTANKFTPNPIMLNFIEHLMGGDYNNILKDKNCLIAVTSIDNGESEGAEVISKAIYSLGGFDAGRIMIGKAYFNDLENNNSLKEIIERQVEDFYRIIRQGRKFFIPGLDDREENKQEKHDTQISNAQIKKLFGEERIPRFKTQDIYNKYSLNAIPEKVQDDINEITNFYAKKYQTGDKANVLISTGGNQIDIDYTTPKPREKTCKQITQSLTHYFKPQFATGLNFTLQLIIDAKDKAEGFDGYMVISEEGCVFFDGTAENADITIMADEKAWLEVVKGTHTAQKAFMIGRLKVRGNFLYLSKIDQMFNFSIAIA